MRISMAVGLAGLWLAHPLFALPYQQFVQCVSSKGSGPVCQLDAGVYTVSATIVVGRSNITILGTLKTSARDTTLRRAPGFLGALAGDAYFAGTMLNGVTIQNLTFDGNRAQNKLDYTEYAPDVSIFAIKDIAFINCQFLNSPNTGLALYGGGTTGVAVNRSVFSNPVIYGLWSDALGDNSGITWQECATKKFVHNILVSNSVFTNAGEPAILGNIIGLELVNNVFSNNHSDSIPFNDDGGQIDLDVCTNNVVIWRNTFQNGAASPNGKVVDGLELHGTNMTIVDNTVKGNSGGGIEMDGAQHIYIANIDPKTGSFSNHNSGIKIAHSSPTFRQTAWITIESAIASNNEQWAVWSDSSGTPKQPVDHLTIRNSCLAGNNMGPTFFKNLGTDVTLENNKTAGCGLK